MYKSMRRWIVVHSQPFFQVHVATKLHAEGKELHKLVLPTVKLYGKDGQSTKRQLPFVADGVSVNIPVLVQMGSEQKCLQGMNAIQKLGIRLTHANGQPVAVQSATGSSTSLVYLVQASTIPGSLSVLKELGLSSSEVIADNWPRW